MQKRTVLKTERGHRGCTGYFVARKTQSCSFMAMGLCRYHCLRLPSITLHYITLQAFSSERLTQLFT
uniref:Uncharacterized protein n=1 Tax=Anguilla anguilla TaxID=7936 RepID=A0A0E9PC03_ANGAN